MNIRVEGVLGHCGGHCVLCNQDLDLSRRRHAGPLKEVRSARVGGARQTLKELDYTRIRGLH
jgi:hypothetical protein